MPTRRSLVVTIALAAALLGVTARIRRGPGRFRRRQPQERTRRRGDDLQGADRQDGVDQLCRDLDARQADRAGRARRHLLLRRHGMDGLCRRTQPDPPRDPAHAARQRDRARRAEGFDRDDRDRPAHGPRRAARHRRPPRHGQCRCGARRQIRQGGPSETRRLGQRRQPYRPGRERARRPRLCRPRRSAGWHRLRHRRRRRAEGSRRRPSSRPTATRPSSTRSP